MLKGAGHGGQVIISARVQRLPGCADGLMSDNKNMPAKASHQVYWRKPEDERPPRGVKLLILTSGGVAVIGDWVDDSNFVAWSPLPKRK